MKTIINELNLLKKEDVIQWSVWKKDLLLLARELTEKIPDPRNAKEHWHSFINTEKHKISKTIRNNYLSLPKTFENPNIFDIKQVITEHPETPHKLSKIIRCAEKVGSNSSLYSDTKKCEKFLNEGNVKIKK